MTDLETSSSVIGGEGEDVRRHPPALAGPQSGDPAYHIKMPTRILDLERFRTILFDAWRRTSLD